MSNKIDQLIGKIYEEGISKAKAEAAGIISHAKVEADKILARAKEKELETLSNAKNKAKEYSEKINAEIQLASRQTINNVKQQIIRLITTSQVEEPIKDAFKNSEFIKSIILMLIKNWNPQKPEELNLNLLLPKNDEAELNEYFNAKAIDKLNKGIEIQYDSKITKGFKIGPKDGSYIISFTDEDFEEYFKGYLKDKTRKLLFSSNQPANGKTKIKKMSSNNQ